MAVLVYEPLAGGTHNMALEMSSALPAPVSAGGETWGNAKTSVPAV